MAGFVRLQKEDFSIEEEVARVKARSRRIGGIVTFLGTARDVSKGREVERLHFEHYSGMAEKKLEEIRTEALARFKVIEVLMVHRYGEIGVGANIVLVVVGAEHRAEAFEACRWCIDRLKAVVPIWKKEVTAGGGVWVEDHA